MLDLPGVHKAVDDGVVERVGHGQPVDKQVDLLDVGLVADAVVHLHHDEVGVVGQPAQAENHHHRHHHFYHLCERTKCHQQHESGRAKFTTCARELGLDKVSPAAWKRSGQIHHLCERVRIRQNVPRSMH